MLGLTFREAEILFWVAQGKANAEIAVILGTAPNTVKKHLQNLMPKIGVESRLRRRCGPWRCWRVERPARVLSGWPGT